VLLGNRNGTFQTHADFGTGTLPSAVAVGDINGDGQMDVAVANASGNTVSLLLNATGTTVMLTSSPNPSQQGQPVTFTATVTGTVRNSRIPTGIVTFATGTVKATAPLSNGMASITKAINKVGSFTVTPSYSGNSVFQANTGAPVVQVVNN
jgi:hypothetical protein